LLAIEYSALANDIPAETKEENCDSGERARAVGLFRSTLGNSQATSTPTVEGGAFWMDLAPSGGPSSGTGRAGVCRVSGLRIIERTQRAISQIRAKVGWMSRRSRPTGETTPRLSGMSKREARVQRQKPTQAPENLAKCVFTVKNSVRGGAQKSFACGERGGGPSPPLALPPHTRLPAGASPKPSPVSSLPAAHARGCSTFACRVFERCAIVAKGFDLAEHQRRLWSTSREQRRTS
jgi:hypothetical protein